MNKQRSKALKQLAEMLPPAYITRPHTETGRLSELYRLKDEGHQFTNELPPLTEENADQMFSIKYEAMEVLNHHKRLKRVWKQKGTKGIQEYLVWLKNHNEQFAKRMKDMEIEQLDPKLFEIAKMKVGSFWKSLIAFLVSFALFFKTDKTEEE